MGAFRCRFYRSEAGWFWSYWVGDEGQRGFDLVPHDGFALKWPHEGRGLVPRWGRRVGGWLPALGSVQAFTSMSVATCGPSFWGAPYAGLGLISFAGSRNVGA